MLNNNLTPFKPYCTTLGMIPRQFPQIRYPGSAVQHAPAFIVLLEPPILTITLSAINFASTSYKETISSLHKDSHQS